MLFQNKDRHNGRYSDDDRDYRDDSDFDESYEEEWDDSDEKPRAGSSGDGGIAELQTWLIGRKAPCDIIYDDPSVSRKHCLIVETAEGFCISDLASANGTFVNETRIYGEVPLYEGDELQVGRVRFTFHERMLHNQ